MTTPTTAAAASDPRDAEIERLKRELAAAERRNVGRVASFEEAWAKMEAKGYQYGRDALEQVRLGWDLGAARAEEAEAEVERLHAEVVAVRFCAVCKGHGHYEDGSGTRHPCPCKGIGTLASLTRLQAVADVSRNLMAGAEHVSPYDLVINHPEAPDALRAALHALDGK